MKIPSTDQIREADAFTIKHEPIKSIDLMERAGGKCFDWIFEHAPALFPSHLSGESDWVFRVVCGVGNNGGDGLVVARLLMRNGYNVELVVIHFADKASKDFEANFDRLGAAAKKQTIHVKKSADIPPFGQDAVVIDAIFGSGLNRPVHGVTAEVIAAINDSGAAVVSIDLPSGVFADGQPDGEVPLAVKADHVLTFQTPKLAFFLAECASHIGQLHILDIGLHPDFFAGLTARFHLISAQEARQLRKARARFSHKGTYGHALLIAGSRGKWGAAILAAEACLRTGAGLTTAHLGSDAVHSLMSRLPECMTSFDESAFEFTSLPDLRPYNAIGAGPGLGTSEASARALKLLIQECKVPLVLDADALNILAENKTWLSFLPKGTILTPHPGEWARLTGEKLCHLKGMERQREWSVKYGIYVLLKGACSTLSTPQGKVWINNTGNPGMATGGSGDVLTGIITGLLAAGYTPFEAAALGAYVHGAAGDLCVDGSAPEALIASDITSHLGAAFHSLGYA